MADNTFTFRVDEELQKSFAETAAARERTPAQLLRILMRDAVQEGTDVQEHDRWFRDEVTQALDEASDPAVKRVPGDSVLSTWQQQRAVLEGRVAGRRA